MKRYLKVLIAIIAMFNVTNSFSQGINFQGVARNASGVILANQKISLRLSIITGNVLNVPDYTETRNAMTNPQGVFSVVVGDTGTITTVNTWSGINWKNINKFLKVEMDPNGTTNYLLMGTTPLQFVPFSYFSNYSIASSFSNHSDSSSYSNLSDNSNQSKVSLHSNYSDNSNYSNFSKLSIRSDTSHYSDNSNTSNFSNFSDTSNFSLGVNARNVSGILPITSGGTGYDNLDSLRIALNIYDTTTLANLISARLSKLDPSGSGAGSVLPTVTSNDAIEITPYGALIPAKIENDGAATILKQGVCFDVTSNPNTSQSQVVFVDANASGSNYLTGPFNVSLNNLCKPNTTYYYKAFAINKNGTAYSAVKSFTTELAVSFLNKPVVSLDHNTASFNISLKSNGDVITGMQIQLDPVQGSGASLNHSLVLNNLTIDTTFTYKFPEFLNSNTDYIASVIINSNKGGVKSDSINIHTGAPVLPIVIIDSFDFANISMVYHITSDGGDQITDHGVVWSAQQSPTISLSTKLSNIDSVSYGTVYSIKIDSLISGTNYYITPYATNASGTYYANSSFQINVPAKAPSVKSDSVNNISYNSANIYATIINNGGGLITSSGIVYDTISNPTISNIFIASNSITSGSFSVTLSNLKVSKKYYYRAYAANAIGGSYGPEFSFTTTSNTIPIISTTRPTVTSSSSASSGGLITKDGGLQVSSAGVVWSTTKTALIMPVASHSSDAISSGSFSSTITGLTPGMKYYIRSYAVNSLGTGYGPIDSVTTVANLPVLSQTSVISDTVISATTTPTVQSPVAYIIARGIIASTPTAITERGIVYSTSALLNYENGSHIIGNDSTTFDCLIIDKNDFNKKLYVRSYARNSDGIGYGPLDSTSIALPSPTISQPVSQNINNSTIILSSGIDAWGAITSDKGFVWGTDVNNLNISTSFKNSLGSTPPMSTTNNFSAMVYGLVNNTTYYIKSYCTINGVTTYSQPLSITTLP